MLAQQIILGLQFN